MYFKLSGRIDQENVAEHRIALSHHSGRVATISSGLVSTLKRRPSPALQDGFAAVGELLAVGDDFTPFVSGPTYTGRRADS